MLTRSILERILNTRAQIETTRPLNFNDLDRHELQLTTLACSTILILRAGLALLMYPVVFSYSSVGLRNAFYGFCGLSALLAMYLMDRQITILHLRRQIAEADKRAAEKQKQVQNS